MKRVVLFTFFFLQITFCFSQINTSFTLEENIPIIINSERCEIDSEKKEVYAEGNVKTQYKDINLSSDNLLLDTETKSLYAERMHLITKRYNLSGDKLYLNLLDFIGEVEKPYMEIQETKIRGEKINLLHNKLIIKDGELTTCKKEHPHYSVKVKDIILKDRKMLFKSISLYYGKNKIFVFPYLVSYASSKKDEEKQELPMPILGYTQDSGLFAKIKYNLSLSDNMDIAVHLQAEKKEGILGEIGIEGKFEDTYLRLFFGRAKERRNSPRGQILNKKPESSLRYSRAYRNIFFHIHGEYSIIKENYNTYINKREAKIGLSNDYNFYNFTFSPSIEFSKALYDKETRELLTSEINVSKKIDNNDVYIKYTKRKEKGKTLFLYDAIDAKNEIEIGNKWFVKNFENKFSVRYNLHSNEFIEYIFGMLYFTDCIKSGINFMYRDNNILAQIRITLL